MQTRKLISIALVAALVSTVTAVSVAARETIPTEEWDGYASKHTFSVIGTLNGTWDTDTELTDEDGDGIYEAVIEDVAPGTYEFKVRADKDWADSWAAYDEDAEAAYNNQVNNSITIEGESANVKVTFDTTDPNPLVWPVAGEIVTDEGSEPVEIPYSVLSVIGTINGNWDTDTPLTDEDGDGIYEVTIPDVQPGDYAFKVRADGEWNGVGADGEEVPQNWGAYDEDAEATRNAGDIKFTLEAASDVTVSINVNNDVLLWAISYTYTDANGETQTVYTGAPVEEDPTTPETPETPATPETPETPETPSTPAEETPAYTTTVNDYIFFDNTNTKWETVYAYWFGTVEGVEGYVDIKDPVGRSYNNQENWPGNLLERVEGTDYWRALKPVGATTIIFSNGYSDEALKEEWAKIKADYKANPTNETLDALTSVKQFQTSDIAFNSETDGGKVYSIKEGAVATQGASGYNLLKNAYAADDNVVADYTGPFEAEKFGQDEINNGGTSDNGNTGSGDNNGTAGNGSTSGNGSVVDNTAATGTDSPATGDATTAAGFAAVAAAALGVAVLASRKKKAND